MHSLLTKKLEQGKLKNRYKEGENGDIVLNDTIDEDYTDDDDDDDDGHVTFLGTGTSSGSTPGKKRSRRTASSSSLDQSNGDGNEGKRCDT